MACPSPERGRKAFGGALLGLAVLILLACLLICREAPRYWAARGIEAGSVAGLRENYAAWSLGLSVVLGLVGVGVRRRRNPFLENLGPAVAIASLLVLADRVLLLAHGLPLWMPDAANHFRQRPNAVRSWDNGKVIRTNSYGYHDYEFPEAKSPGEFRGVMLGDSVTMGDSVVYEETFSCQLERLLRQAAGPSAKVKIINTGVQGYSTFQEANMFAEALRFKPDFAAVGFCMNDVTEPAAVDRRFGGAGFDYHEVLQLRPWTAMILANETGFGRFLLGLRPVQERLEAESRAKFKEAADVEYMARRPVDDPRTAEGWRSVLESLDRMRSIAQGGGTRLVLMIFPFTFQLHRKDLQRPQRILIEYGARTGLPVVDLTPVFEGLAHSPAAASRYFLDEDHFTPEGHRIVAERLARYLRERRMYPPR